MATNIQEYSDIQLTFTSADTDRKITFGSATGTTEGIEIEYDRLTATKTFKISPAGVNWNDGVDNYNTSLARLAVVQQAFQAVELPPNATTLKLDRTILLDAGVATQSTTINDGTAILSNASTGGAVNPQLTLTNTNATGSVALEIYKDKPTAGVAGDVLFNQSVYGKDSFLNKQEYTRITHTIRDGTGGIEDGSIEFGCFVNGSFANFLQINGNQNEVNCLKPLDMGNNNITTSTGDMTIDTTGSSGSGNITIAGKSAGTTNINATTIGINASSILTMSATGAGAYMTATIDDAITLTSVNDDIILNANNGSCKVSATSLQLNTINIIPRNSFNTGAFSVAGTPPNITIVNFGAPADMIANTTWKVEVGFYTGAINNRNIITYIVVDTTNTDCVLNSVFGYANGGLQTAIQYDPAGTPMGTYCSFVDTFQINSSAVGACSFILTGGTSDSSTWSGTYRTSIILTRLQ